MATAVSSTVVKAFRVLELFGSHPLIGAADCARLLDMPRASAHRMLVSLAQAGALEVTAGGQYRLTLKMFELGLHVPYQRWLYDAAYLPMEKLVVRTKLATHLAVRDGIELVYLVKLRHAPDRTRARPGQRNCLHATALGKVLLAYAPEETRCELVSRGLFPLTPHTITTEPRLREQLEEIRTDGYAYDFEERTLGIVSVAVPVRDKRSRKVIAALSLLAPGEKYRSRLTSLRRDLARARDEIVASLDGRPRAQV